LAPSALKEFHDAHPTPVITLDLTKNESIKDKTTGERRQLPEIKIRLADPFVPDVSWTLELSQVPVEMIKMFFIHKQK